MVAHDPRWWRICQVGPQFLFQPWQGIVAECRPLNKSRTTLKWNKKSLQFRTLTPHLEVPSAQRLTVCTAVSLAWCPRPSPAATPTLPGPSGATASSPQQLSRILAAEEWTREHWHWHLTPTTLHTHLIINIALFNCQTLPMSARECCDLRAVVTLQLAGTRAGTLGRWHSIIKTSVIRSEEWF